MNTKFKVGDKVYCVNDGGFRSIKTGNKYTVSHCNDSFVYLEGIPNYEWHYTHFKLIKENKYMNNKKIAIKVGNNQELSRIVQEFLFSKGYEWLTGRNIIGTSCPYIHLDYFKEKQLAHGPLDSNYVEYDAATQFGEIITLLSEPPKPVIKIKSYVGTEYEADFTQNPGYVTFGCAKIAKKAFIELKKVLFDIKIDLGDSKIVEQIKIGRGLFSPADIKAIVEHPDFNKSL